MILKNPAYVAGIIDAEGYISIQKQKRYNRVGYQYKAFISIGMVDKTLIDELNSEINGNIKILKRHNRQDMYYINCYSIKSFELLNQVYPYLLVKKDQADILLSFYKIKQNQISKSYSLESIYQKFYEKLKLLKQKTNKDYSSLPKINSTINTTTLSYTAGIIDGDGCIGKYQYPKRILVQFNIEMNQPEAICLIQSLFGGNILIKEKGTFRLSLTDSKTKFLLKSLLPYLKLKKQKAQECLEFLNSK